MTYWRSWTTFDAHDLDQVGITLIRRTRRYFVGGIVRKAGLDDARVEGVEIGDELIAVDELNVRGASMDAVLSALHGSPGATRRLVVERGGVTLEVDVGVAAFD